MSHVKLTSESAAEIIYRQLIFMKGQRPGTKCKYRSIYVKALLQGAAKTFFEDPIVLTLEPPCIVVGSMFGHFYDLLCLFETFGYPPAQKYLFLGNIIGNGPQSLETLLLITCLKLKFPNMIYVIRGQNEILCMNSQNKFKLQLQKQCDDDIYDLCNQLFDYLPLVAILGSQIYCVCSGLSPDLPHIETISSIIRPFPIEKTSPYFSILSSKPNSALDTWNNNTRADNVQFGIDAVSDFLDTNNLKMIICSNEILEEGFEFPLNGDNKFLTISSVPYYIDKTEKLATILNIDETLKIEFLSLRPLAYIYRHYYKWISSNKKPTNDSKEFV